MKKPAIGNGQFVNRPRTACYHFATELGSTDRYRQGQSELWIAGKVENPGF